MEIFLISDRFVRGLLEASKLQKKLLPFVYGGGGGVISLMTYTGRCAQKGYLFSSFKYMKR